VIAQIIVTADDAGLCPAVNNAIIDLYHRGSISRAALFGVYGNCEDLCREIPRYARVAHVSLSFGQPMTTSEGIVRLTEADGSFIRPAIDQTLDLPAALERHCDWLMKTTPASDIQAEIQAQFDSISPKLDGNREYTFHHDIDRFLTPDYYRPKTEILSRRDCLECGVYAGYRYLFLSVNDTESVAAQKIAAMLLAAIDDSIASGGLPVEVALHPATSGRDFNEWTSYRDQRYVEFRAWQSKRIQDILARGERMGNRFVFTH
jgi:predicted glycoside hydrolase/deacetylase ChbG (UPF0249 family)